MDWAPNDKDELGREEDGLSDCSTGLVEAELLGLGETGTELELTAD